MRQWTRRTPCKQHTSERVGSLQRGKAKFLKLTAAPGTRYISWGHFVPRVFAKTSTSFNNNHRFLLVH